MTSFDFGKYPTIQRHLRELAAFGFLDEKSIRELVESLGEVLNENERLLENANHCERCDPRGWK